MSGVGASAFTAVVASALGGRPTHDCAVIGIRLRLLSAAKTTRGARFGAASIDGNTAAAGTANGVAACATKKALGAAEIATPMFAGVTDTFVNAFGGAFCNALVAVFGTTLGKAFGNSLGKAFGKALVNSFV
jgi:hypothetical protein